jgi:hypothetical protein
MRLAGGAQLGTYEIVALIVRLGQLTRKPRGAVR